MGSLKPGDQKTYLLFSVLMFNIDHLLYSTGWSLWLPAVPSGAYMPWLSVKALWPIVF